MTRRALPVIVLVVSCVSFMFSTALVGQSPNRRDRQDETVMETAARLNAWGFGVEQDSLSLTSSRDEASPDRQATTSIARLRIPEKARDAYRKRGLSYPCVNYPFAFALVTPDAQLPSDLHAIFEVFHPHSGCNFCQCHHCASPARLFSDEPACYTGHTR